MDERFLSDWVKRHIINETPSKDIRPCAAGCGAYVDAATECSYPNRPPRLRDKCASCRSRTH
jgi:hypothetical protein